jgi:hypothetical protein
MVKEDKRKQRRPGTWKGKSSQCMSWPRRADPARSMSEIVSAALDSCSNFIASEPWPLKIPFLAESM